MYSQVLCGHWPRHLYPDHHTSQVTPCPPYHVTTDPGCYCSPEDAGDFTCQVATADMMEQTFTIEIKGGYLVFYL